MATKKTKVELSAETSKYEKSMRNVRASSKKTAQSIKASFGRIAGTLGKVSGLISIVGVAGFGVLAKEALDTGDKIHKLNLRLGLSTEALSQLQHVADLSGVEFMTVAKSVQKMQENISDAAQGIGTAKDSLKEINLNFTQLKSLSPEKQLEAIADALLGIENKADRVRIAADIFGGRGVEMLQIMSAGATGIRKMREEADRLGITLSQEAAQAIADANDSMARIQTSIKGVTRSLIVELAPGIEDVSGKISDWVILNRGLMEQEVPKYFDKIKTSLSKIWDIIQYNPAIIKFGLIGLATYGTRGAVALAGLAHMSTWAKNFGAAMGLAAAGMVDAKDVASANFKELEEIIERADQMMAGPKFHKVSWPKPDQSGTPASPENLERTKEYYKQLEALAQEKRAFELELEDEETRVFEENLAYRLELKQQYYRDIEAAAQEARDSDEEWENQKMRSARETAAYQKKTTGDEVKTRLSFYQSMAGGISGIFSQIAQVGGKQSEEAFRMYQAFAIIEATIAANLAAAKVVGQLGIFGIPLSSMVWSMAMANVAMIAAAQPPSYDQGGISRAAGVYQTGPIAEAHVPLKGGAIPVNLSGASQKPTIIIHMENPVFQDLDTQRQVFAQIADVVARQVAPGAVIENYNDDLGIRQMVRGGT